MKKSFLLLMFLVVLGTSSFKTQKQASYCDGWEIGYREGYCYEDNYCISPIVPICPIPEINQDEFVDGYNRGFLRGLNDRE